MPIVKYKDIRGVDKNCNPLTTHRPSAQKRIVKGILQYAIFQSSLNYGIIFEGFGLHNYFKQATGQIQRVKPWIRTQTIGTNFVKYGLISLPFFYSKEVIFSSIDSFTKDKPSLRKLFNYSFVVNFIATGFIFPLFYFIEKRNLIKSIRSSLALCLFSLVNDVFIDLRRKQLFVENYSRQQMQEIFVKNRIAEVREHIKQDLKSKSLPNQKRTQLQNLNLQLIQNTMMTMTTPKTYQTIQNDRRRQLSTVGQMLRTKLDQIKKKANILNMLQKK